MDRPRLADLFCGAGGSAMGLHRAGFEVVGFDIKPQKHYPFEFHQQDAFSVDLSGFDAVWASPPCQKYTVASIVHRNNGKEYPSLIEPIRRQLVTSSLPYLIENVPGSPLIEPVMLCGLMFGLKVLRHRLFETNYSAFNVPHPSHKGVRIGEGYYSIAGGAGRWKSWGIVYRNISKGTAKQWAEAMGIDWMTRDELSQAIPPAYSEFLGKQLMKVLGE